MCDHGKKKNKEKRIGSALEHGSAHTDEHNSWNRRKFLTTSGLAGLGMSMMLGNSTVKAFSPSDLGMGLSHVSNDRVLVLIRLKGGVDGLNTIVPRFNSVYYNERPTLAVQEANMFAMDSANGLPLDTMGSLQSLYQNNEMKVVHNVGYPNPDYSHFRSSDIWATASDSDEIVTTGWIGRYVDNLMPAYIDAPPTVPPALQIGVQTNLLFNGPSAKMALTIDNAEQFYQIAQNGSLYSTAGLTDCPKDLELGFMRQTANNAFRYSESIQDAYQNSTAFSGYPGYNPLAERLSIVARLIKGRLGTKIYLVEIDGFDTHAEQAGYMPGLLQELSTATKAFYDDLSAAGFTENTLIMTFSEFGRTYKENDSLGTDHGTGAPILFFGQDMGGIVGSQPNLFGLGEYDDPTYDIDFRGVYATVLQDWLCVDPNVVNYTMGADFMRMSGLISNPCSPALGANNVAALLGHNPNRANPTMVDIKYGIKQRGNVRLQLLSESGQVLRTFFNEFKERGSYTFSFSRVAYNLQAGDYMYRMDTGGMIYMKKIKLS